MNAGELLKQSERLAERGKDIIREAEKVSLRAAVALAHSDAAVARADALLRSDRGGPPAKPKHS